MDHFGIIKRAWRILWNYKVLWVFGVLTALTSGAGGGGGGNAGANFRGNGRGGADVQSRVPGRDSDRAARAHRGVDVPGACLHGSRYRGALRSRNRADQAGRPLCGRGTQALDQGGIPCGLVPRGLASLPLTPGGYVTLELDIHGSGSRCRGAFSRMGHEVEHSGRLGHGNGYWSAVLSWALRCGGLYSGYRCAASQRACCRTD